MSAKVPPGGCPHPQHSDYSACPAGRGWCWRVAICRHEALQRELRGRTMGFGLAKIAAWLGEERQRAKLFWPGRPWHGWKGCTLRLFARGMHERPVIEVPGIRSIALAWQEAHRLKKWCDHDKIFDIDLAEISGDHMVTRSQTWAKPGAVPVWRKGGEVIAGAGELAERWAQRKGYEGPMPLARYGAAEWRHDPPYNYREAVDARADDVLAAEGLRLHPFGGYMWRDD